MRGGDDGIFQRLGADAGPLRPDHRDHALDDGRGGSHIFVQDGDHLLHRHILFRLVPDVVVGDEAHGRIADLRLAAEFCLLQIGHPDDVYSPASVDAGLGPRRELWALHTKIGPPLVHRRADLGARAVEEFAQVGAHRIGETHMGHQSVPEEGARPRLGPVKELIGDDDIERANLLPHAPHRRGRDDPLDIQGLEPIDVRPKVEFRGEQPVSATVASQEGDRVPVQAPEDVGIRGITERGRDPFLSEVGQALHVVQAASPNDADHGFRHFTLP